MTAHKIGTITSSCNNFVRATFLIGQFSNFTCGCVTLNLEAGHDKIAKSKFDGATGFISAFAVGCTAFLGQEAEDLLREAGGRGT